MMQALAARRATNLYGKLSTDVLARIDALVTEPTAQTWDDAYSIIVNASRFTTLWQAVIAVDPTFTPTCPAHHGDGSPSEPWPAVPTREVILAALDQAV